MKLLDNYLINIKIKIRCILLVVNYLKAKEAIMNSSSKSISLIKKAKASPLRHLIMDKAKWTN